MLINNTVCGYLELVFSLEEASHAIEPNAFQILISHCLHAVTEVFID